MVATLINILVKGKVWKVPREFVEELINKGYRKTTKSAANAPTMTRRQANKVPLTDAKHFAEVAKDLRISVGRQKVGRGARGARTAGEAESRAGRETAAKVAAKQARDLKAIRKNLPKVDRLGRVKDWWKGKTKQEKNTFMRRVGYTGTTAGLVIWLASNLEAPKTRDIPSLPKPTLRTPVKQTQSYAPEKDSKRKTKKDRKPLVKARRAEKRMPDISGEGAWPEERELKPWEGRVRYLDLPEWLGGGRIKVDSSSDVFKQYETSGDKHGGQIKKSMKKSKANPRKAKAKTRKHAALGSKPRGVGAATHGYGKAMKII